MNLSIIILQMVISLLLTAWSIPNLPEPIKQQVIELSNIAVRIANENFLKESVGNPAPVTMQEIPKINNEISKLIKIPQVSLEANLVTDRFNPDPSEYWTKGIQRDLVVSKKYDYYTRKWEKLRILINLKDVEDSHCFKSGNDFWSGELLNKETHWEENAISASDLRNRADSLLEFVVSCTNSNGISSSDKIRLVIND